ncbi:hypothetical protein K7432_013974 [Basidiobolus ranarum]|uniref:Arrestin C-terminal-like domain-containing protein n=1 Tax=Basidiobolus ranarum TaxID=34480 RepID=A0ABR2WII1_9FUNG
MAKKKLSLKLLLERDILIFNGTPAESVGALLKGKVVLDLKESLDFMSLDLNLRGVFHHNWSEMRGNQHVLHFSNTVLINESWHLVRVERKSHYLPAGIHTFDFEYVFNGSLPETIHLDNGGVEYKLQATLHRGFLRGNVIAQKEVEVRRYLHFFNSDFDQSTQFSSVWNNMLSYDICLPSKMVGLDEFLPIGLKLSSICDTTEVRKAGCYIKEIITKHTPDTYAAHVENRWIKLLNIDPEDLNSSQYHSMNVFISSRDVHITCTTKWVTVDHILVIKIKLKGFYSGTQVVALEVPFMVLSSSSKDVTQSLPTYSLSDISSNTASLPMLQPPPSYTNAIIEIPKYSFTS